MSIVILAEKPSQGRAYAEAFSNINRKDGYIEVNDSLFFNGKAFITWGFGHLVELVSPKSYKEEWGKWSVESLPILPKSFKFQVGKGKQKQFNVVKNLLQQADEVVVATDADREGENIARSIMQLAGVSSKPTKRLWINSLEVDEIQKGFRDLKNGNDCLPLYTEAQTRQYSDWLVGMNGSRLYTVLLQKKGLQGVYSVGRVQSPTLFLIYKREQEIKNFVSKPFYELFADVTANNGKFKAKYKGRFDKEEEVKELLQKHGIKEQNSGVIESVEKELKKTHSPKLHSLSTLQTVANKRWKYSPSDVLKIVQELYEKKLLSYPRTDTQYITESEFAYIKSNLDAYKNALGVQFNVVYPDARKRYVDGSKVQEHYAIVPTKQVAKVESLSEKERNIYVEVLSTTLAMFADDYQYEETKITVNVNELLFSTTGKVEKDKGWKVLFGKNSDDEKKKDEQVLPAVEKGENCNAFVSVKDGMTKPPKPYTEGGLINMMKTAGKELQDDGAKEVLKQTEGIGTEATRASVIETLKNQQYIAVKSNKVSVTKKGEILCQAIDGTLLASPEMTAKWEAYLAKIGKKQGSQQSFLDSIERFIMSLLEVAPKQVQALEGEIAEVSEQSFIGDCPSCGKGRIQEKGKFYGCTEYRNGCKFSLPKAWAGKTIPKKDIESLMVRGKSGLIKGFKSKKGSKYDAYLVLKDGKIRMEFPK